MLPQSLDGGKMNVLGVELTFVRLRSDRFIEIIEINLFITFIGRWKWKTLETRARQKRRDHMNDKRNGGKKLLRYAAIQQ